MNFAGNEGYKAINKWYIVETFGINGCGVVCNRANFFLLDLV